MQWSQLHTVDSNSMWDVHPGPSLEYGNRSRCLGECVEGWIRHIYCDIPWIRVCIFWLGGEVGWEIGRCVWARAERADPGWIRVWLWHRQSVQKYMREWGVGTTLGLKSWAGSWRSGRLTGLDPGEGLDAGSGWVGRLLCNSLSIQMPLVCQFLASDIHKLIGHSNFSFFNFSAL